MTVFPLPLASMAVIDALIAKSEQRQQRVDVAVQAAAETLWGDRWRMRLAQLLARNEAFAFEARAWFV